MRFTLPFFKKSDRSGRSAAGASLGSKLSSRPDTFISQGPGDELIAAIGEAVCVCADRKLAGWEALALVYDINDAMSANSGFLYKGDMIRPFSARLSDKPMLLSKKFRDFRDLVIAESGHAYCQLLLQIVSGSNRIRIDFEFDDPTRWSIGPSNLKAMRETLRPDLSFFSQNER